MSNRILAPAIQLYDYQQEAVDSLFRCWEKGDGTGHLIVLPTGSGKAYTIAEIMRRLMLDGAKKILMLTHVSELLTQNYTSLRKLWPAAPVGLFSAGLGRKDHRTPIVIGGIQSVARNLERFRHVDAMIVDECHLLNPESSDSQYRATLDHLRRINPKLKFVGLTATPYRLSSGNLCEPYKGHAPLFDTVVYEMTVGELLHRGKLCPMKARGTSTRVDVSGVAKRGGEFIDKDLNAAVNVDAINKAAIDEVVKTGLAENCRSWLGFAISIDHATRLRDLVREHGITCEVVHSKITKQERARCISGFKSFNIRCLINVGVLTTGFDHPATDLLFMLRPTMSPGLFSQILGRGLRTFDGKKFCIVLDFAGNVLRHGLVDAVRGVHKDGDELANEPKAKECPKCQHLNPPGTKICQECEHAFPPPKAPAVSRESKLSAKSVADRVMKYDADGEKWMTVTGAEFARHQDGIRPSIRFQYTLEGSDRKVSEWLQPEHPGWNGKKAQEIWRRRSVVGLPPRTTDEALTRIAELRRPKRLLVRKEGIFLEVVSAEL
jgi:DNA repair protein RadD